MGIKCKSEKDWDQASSWMNLDGGEGVATRGCVEEGLAYNFGDFGLSPQVALELGNIELEQDEESIDAWPGLARPRPGARTLLKLSKLQMTRVHFPEPVLYPLPSNQWLNLPDESDTGVKRKVQGRGSACAIQQRKLLHAASS